jgi:hypothetical protein
VAQRVITTLVDDIDGTDADETVSFALDGKNYEIDLSSDKAEALREIIRPYGEKGRRLGGRGRPRSTATSGAVRVPSQSTPKNVTTDKASANGKAVKAKEPKVDTGTVRAWAGDNGYKVSDRGRIPSKVFQAFMDAHPM